jgi:putative nucleotidyltransferase with HDIG domain
MSRGELPIVVRSGRQGWPNASRTARMHATASKSKTSTQLKPKAATPKAKKAAPAVAGTRRNGAKPPASRPKPAAAVAKVATQEPASTPAPSGERHQNEGHGRRLTMAFEALEAFPALAESRARLLAVVSKDHVATADVVTAVESDVALIIAVLRIANQVQDGRGRVDTVVAAVELLTPQTVHGLAGRLRTFDFFERSSVWEAAPERFRLHALATQHAADRIAAEVGFENRDRLTATSLLHDIGKLVLLHAYPGYPSQVHRGARTPEERIHQERRELGVDHALVGGVLARRWGLPATIASTIERHHNADAEGEAALVRLADMLAHYEQGAPVSPAEMLRSARVVGLGPAELRRVMYELPSVPSQRRRHVDPCPLSGRELSVLQRLAEGKVYKQIAHELTLSTSTVRTHLHNIYGKLGAVDRAQAVLIATERGWL